LTEGATHESPNVISSQGRTDQVTSGKVHTTRQDHRLGFTHGIREEEEWQDTSLH
jgi:hypothetical protein